MPVFESSPSSIPKSGLDLECQPLLDLSTPSLFRRNAFRILGLATDAGTKEVLRQTDKLLKMAEFSGTDGLQQAHGFALLPDPSLDELREAVQRLKEPEQRLLDEFFWFWPSCPKASEDPAMQSLLGGDADAALQQWAEQEVPDSANSFIARHNIAVLFHLTALDWSLHDLEHGVDADREAKMVQYWHEAFERWEVLVTDARMWDWVRDRIAVLNDPRLTSGFARRMEAVLPQAFDKINAELAVEYARRSNDRLAEWHVTFLRSTHAGLDDTDRVSALVLRSSRDRILRAVENATQNALKIQRKVPLWRFRCSTNVSRWSGCLTSSTVAITTSVPNSSMM